MVSVLIQRTRDYFMKREPIPAEDPKSDDTAPGVRLLKKVWNIEPVKPRRDPAPSNVGHDIYNVPTRKSEIPPRQYGDKGR